MLHKLTLIISCALLLVMPSSAKEVNQADIVSIHYAQTKINEMSTFISAVTAEKPDAALDINDSSGHLHIAPTKTIGIIITDSGTNNVVSIQPNNSYRFRVKFEGIVLTLSCSTTVSDNYIQIRSREIIDAFSSSDMPFYITSMYIRTEGDHIVYRIAGYETGQDIKNELAWEQRVILRPIFPVLPAIEEPSGNNMRHPPNSVILPL